MSNDESQCEKLLERIVERLSKSLQSGKEPLARAEVLGSDVSPKVLKSNASPKVLKIDASPKELKSDATPEMPKSDASPEVLGSNASPEKLGSDSATTTESSGSAAPIYSRSNTRLDFVLDYFHRTFCDFFYSMPVFKKVGVDMSQFVLACRFVSSRAQPLLPDFPDLQDLMEELVSELRNLGLQLYLEVERAKVLKTRCFRFVDTIHQAALDGAFSSDTMKDAKDLLDEMTTFMSLINVIIRDNRRRIHYFYTLRTLILSHFCQN